MLFAFTIFFLSLNILNNFVYKMKIDTSKKYIFIGDSQVQYAVNDTIFIESKNLAIDSECFYYSYFRIKALIEANPEIDTIYLGFNYHSLSGYWDNYIEGEWSFTRSSRYFYLMPTKEKFFILKANKDDLFNYFIKLVKNGVYNLVSEQKSYEGGFLNTFEHSRAEEEMIKERIKYQFFDGEKLLGFSEINILYFDKIIELCKSSEINLILINMPVHQYYKANVPERFVKKFDQIFYNAGLDILDLGDLQLNDSCYYHDGDHVSQMGAVLTTIYLEKILN